MADKTIGELKRATSLDDDSLLIAEQQGEAVSVTGGLFKSFAQETTKGFAESASADAAAAVGAKEAAQSALKGVQDALNNLPAGGTLVINDLTTGGTTAALSAEMGKTLKQELSDLDYADVGAAPAGYGLGEYAAVLDAVDINTVRKNGWYRLTSTCTNVPTTSDGVGSCSGALLEVISSTTSYVAEQRIYLGTAGQQGYALRRFYNNATKAWQPWDWINPRMLEGKEYRTTERYLDKPVYAKLVAFGALPNASTLTVAHGATNVKLVIDIEAVNGSGVPLSGYPAVTALYASASKIAITTNDDLSATTANVLLKYTKTTD